MMRYNLCGGKGRCCPQVHVGEDSVKIGEKGDIVTLTKSEWNTLIGKIKSGEIN